MKASMSSLDWNSGNFPVKNVNKITPADHTSIAVTKVNYWMQMQKKPVEQIPTSGLLTALQ